MEPEMQHAAREEEPGGAGVNRAGAQAGLASGPGTREIRGVDWIVNGSGGMRAAWSVAVFTGYSAGKRVGAVAGDAGRGGDGGFV
jgi:hypothetical protein